MAIFLVLGRGACGAMASSTNPRHSWMEDADYALLSGKVSYDFSPSTVKESTQLT